MIRYNAKIASINFIKVWGNWIYSYILGKILLLKIYLGSSTKKMVLSVLCYTFSADDVLVMCSGPWRHENPRDVHHVPSEGTEREHPRLQQRLRADQRHKVRFTFDIFRLFLKSLFSDLVKCIYAPLQSKCPWILSADNLNILVD